MIEYLVSKPTLDIEEPNALYNCNTGVYMDYLKLIYLVSKKAPFYRVPSTTAYGSNLNSTKQKGKRQ
jgi:hypothetical protein